ncbi:hypothetical protein ALO_14327 [Acetonema longum DSM 6540]|uniref:Uncharacterized protein n=1 Tax=Acetonema longum DSM 6540 TaxID=1009370 RepID=F7NL93_9FIRM|nr:hypothetical protein ALO_14327 [Acetonema longum DSM 6540]
MLKRVKGLHPSLIILPRPASGRPSRDIISKGDSVLPIHQRRANNVRPKGLTICPICRPDNVRQRRARGDIILQVGRRRASRTNSSVFHRLVGRAAVISVTGKGQMPRSNKDRINRAGMINSGLKTSIRVKGNNSLTLNNSSNKGLTEKGLLIRGSVHHSEIPINARQ